MDRRWTKTTKSNNGAETTLQTQLLVVPGQGKGEVMDALDTPTIDAYDITYSGLDINSLSTCRTVMTI
jgi:hypothetical protein